MVRPSSGQLTMDVQRDFLQNLDSRDGVMLSDIGAPRVQPNGIYKPNLIAFPLIV